MREETATDHDAVLAVHREAFGRDAEALLVHRLRRERVDMISLLAEARSSVIGSVIFSEAVLVLESKAGLTTVAIGALGPVAVLSFERRQGVAADLIREGLRYCWRRSWPAVIVLGNPGYYGRFGFERADSWSIRCELDVPPEAFMIVFAGDVIRGPGIAKYHPAFASV